MNHLTDVRLEFLGSFIDGPEILEHIKQLGVQKNIDLPKVDEYIAQFRENETRFLRKVNSGRVTELPPNNLFSMNLQKFRTLDSNAPLIDSLETVLSFDENQQVFVDYVINDADGLAAWCKKHPELDEQTLKNHLDSYLLEYFEEQGLVVQDSKLYDASTGKLLTYKDYQEHPAGQQTQRLVDKLKKTGWIAQSKLTYTSPEITKANLEQMVR